MTEQSGSQTGTTWYESTPSWPAEDTTSAQRPNVVVVLLDDVGFSHLGCYGSDISTPVIDQLARRGLRYNNFTTTALCSPTRASLLTGRNHHRVGMASIAELVNGFPNNRGRVDERAGMLQEILRGAGYNTFASGKWHLVAAEEQSMAGPFDNWPLGRGFERFYGFLAGDTNHWNPTLVQDNHPVDAPARPEDGYHLTTDLVDRAIGFITDQQSAAPGKPFFCYLALGAGHAPHHAFPDDIAAYRGHYAKGWDRVRLEWFRRQKELGIIPADAQLAPRGAGIPAWDSLPSGHQELFARMMEIYAAFLTHADRQIGRLVRTLEDIGQLDNTLLIVLSDNGASAEGGYEGLLNQWAFFNGVDVSVDDVRARMDELGSPSTFNHYPIGWAQVGNTPFSWYKRWVHAGGVRTPLIIHWPEGIGDTGGIRTQFHHVTDIMPTVLDATGVQVPETLRGIPQMPVDGISMRYTFTAADAPTRKSVQYYEMFGNRAIWCDGWKAVAQHQRDVTSVHPQSFDEDRWELYHVDHDYSELRDLSDELPEKIAELVRRWWEQANENGVLPLDDRLLGRDLRPAKAGSSVYYPGSAPLNPWAVGHVHKTDHVITAIADLPGTTTEGVILSLGGRFGGWALFMRKGHLIYEYNFGDIARYRIESPAPLAAGSHRIEARVNFEESAAHVVLAIDGDAIATGTVGRTFPYVMGLEPLTCGYESQTPVSDSYTVPFRFTGTLQRVEIRIADGGPGTFTTEAEIGAVLVQE
jgi:arylsulfatase A-like enzyme